jgi:hypothetical protein
MAARAADLILPTDTILRSSPPSSSSARSRSYWACIPIQNAGEVPTWRASRSAISAVTAVCSLTAIEWMM